MSFKNYIIKQYVWAPIQSFLDIVFTLPITKKVKQKVINTSFFLLSLNNIPLTKLMLYNRPLIKVEDTLSQSQIKIHFSKCFFVVQTKIFKNN